MCMWLRRQHVYAIGTSNILVYIAINDQQEISYDQEQALEVRLISFTIKRPPPPNVGKRTQN
jgi:hypothetical protein